MQDARPRGWQAVATWMGDDGSLWPSSAGQLGRPISRGDGDFLLADGRNWVGEDLDCSNTRQSPELGGGPRGPTAGPLTVGTRGCREGPPSPEWVLEADLPQAEPAGPGSRSSRSSPALCLSVRPCGKHTPHAARTVHGILQVFSLLRAAFCEDVLLAARESDTQRVNSPPGATLESPLWDPKAGRAQALSRRPRGTPRFLSQT